MICGFLVSALFSYVFTSSSVLPVVCIAVLTGALVRWLLSVVAPSLNNDEHEPSKEELALAALQVNV